MLKSKKLWFRILIILIGLLILVGLSFGTIKANDYYRVNKIIQSSNELTRLEKYQEAIQTLELAQNRWTINTTRELINSKLNHNAKLLIDQTNYNSGNTLFSQDKWVEARAVYSKVSVDYPYYKEAQDKIKECQNKIDESTVAQTQAQRHSSNTSTPSVIEEDCSKYTSDYDQFVCQMNKIPYNPNQNTTETDCNTDLLGNIHCTTR